ncbi:hypothetical protein VC83_09417 [Pseudogymnoascus destructans]|uniref:Uncharacterized protein n=1 Tax=Pseudogymnoascus destructans TaxID=655981 RepID=A0A176ZZZ1_9PEZI|nr:uncharacterized protein VC83_09417 [Pseudogymnoascus destructans]OAF54403.1 hypothetical protein VC83_09417 [Pseudogymnoascus destructans]
MASTEVDQKFLGQFAKNIASDNPLLSSMLFKLLGLSVVLAKQLVRARKLRKLDPTRATKSLDLYFHIIWLSREGLLIVEQYVLHMVSSFEELKVLTYKLRASFYHIFKADLYNIPTPNETRDNPAPQQTSSSKAETTSPPPWPPSKKPTTSPSGSSGAPTPSASASKPNSPPSSTTAPKTPTAPAASPKNTIAEVYNATEGMDDEMFEDAAELVGTLGKFMKRGLGSAGDSSSGSKSTLRAGAGAAEQRQEPSRPLRSTPPRAENLRNEALRDARATPPRATPPRAVPPRGLLTPPGHPRRDAEVSPAVSGVGMDNPI